MNIGILFGTRPEIIKLAPVYKELQNRAIPTTVIHTGQHEELASSMLDLFQIKVDYNLKSMHHAPGLAALTEYLLHHLSKLLRTIKLDALIVQGDTTSAYVGALAAFYLKIPVYHVEAGLRSFDMHNPFPEELNRKQISAIATHHFAPTTQAIHNLVNEGISEDAITLTGNTVVDALKTIRALSNYQNSTPSLLSSISQEDKLVLLTLHRRENIGKPFIQVLKAIHQLLVVEPNIIVLFPAHPNPKLQESIEAFSVNNERFKILSPLGYVEFQHLLDRCDLILTDSGGLQEEAAALGKKLLVLRTKTERQELLDSDFTELLGTDPKKIVEATHRVLSNASKKMPLSVYGDGNTAKKIVDHLLTR
ncbi:non-hydrolyzing UDP-N-acetylglucosamine 2-epimerase [Balneola vulgaris]|uniref:non-hydrolyzing UDP-N-acetylglucosamine 2-epimerase n=1 Tax=Balneola vulgaris TaxID=287535 RepID=UPI000361F85A|nr:UDP-N-acetylglucosamine 2-epimerase (non-hydrolyzing) [Balneola vulgaris]